jgi:hypothetical protein
MPQRERTEKDRIYLELLRHRGALFNKELVEVAAEYHPLFRKMKPNALEKDVDRFVGRQLKLKTIERVDGRLRILQEITSPSRSDESNWRFAYDLVQIQVDIRDRQSKQIVHIFSYAEARNISDGPLTSLNRELLSSVPQTWEERNVVEEVTQRNVTRRWDAQHKPTFGEYSNPYRLQYTLDLSRPLDMGEAVTLTHSYATKNLDGVYTISDLPPTERLVFDVVKFKRDDVSLHCFVSNPRTGKGDYAPETATDTTVTNLLSHRKVYALCLAMANPRTGRNYRFEYRWT